MIVSSGKGQSSLLSQHYLDPTPFTLRCIKKNVLIFRISTVHKSARHVSQDIFTGDKDRFKGLTIDSNKQKCTQNNFLNKLEESLSEWTSQGHRCIWFRVSIKQAFWVPLLAEKGFNFHHARDDFVMMYKWLPLDSEPNLPPPCHTNLGVGAMVFNKRDQILAISEKHYEYPHWKLPGGYVERG
ncbi:hypothetical protein O3G_MSEX002313 [Manduca sexta]|uniref:Pre-nudix hydrolase domain-containing protein n=1 Tax=Manduca sexta TaxID=7130 RepID=A0A922CDZ5_MANSE|nr:hypothetical protein O3G_MSEX002313 [Manduca sexta]